MTLKSSESEFQSCEAPSCPGPKLRSTTKECPRHGIPFKMRLSLLFTLFSLTATAFAADNEYLGLPLAAPVPNRNPQIAIRNCYGVPFVQGQLPLEQGGTASIAVGGSVGRIFLLGMTDQISEEERIGRSRRGPSEIIRPAVPVDAWTDPLDQSTRFWVGDKLGEVRLEYVDGTTETYP
jgi:hypothetical protein